MKKCLLVTLDYAPNFGGVSAYWQRVTASMPVDKWVVLKPSLFRWVWPHWLLVLWQTRREYRRNKCEMIVAAQLLPIGTAAYILRAVFGMPYIVQIYGMDLAQARRSSRKFWLARLILAKASGVLANSQATAKLAEEFGCNAERCTIVYPIPTQPGSVSPKAVAGKKIVLSVGRLVERKGQDMVIKAMHAVLREVQQVVYVIVGDGPDRERLQMLSRPLGEVVVFAGAVSQAERDAWLAGCDVFIMPSRSSPEDVEGFGMVFLEAGALGKPVIGGRGGGVGEAIVDGKTGILVNPYSSEDIASTLLRLLKDESLAKSLGAGGKMVYEAVWSWEKEVAKLKGVLS